MMPHLKCGIINTDKENKMANTRTTGGIIGPGAKNVTPIYRPQTMFGGTISTAPKAPSKKKGPSLVDKFIAGFKKEMTRPTQRVRSTDGD
jgi:hypothetical protein